MLPWPLHPILAQEVLCTAYFGFYRARLNLEDFGQGKKQCCHYFCYVTLEAVRRNIYVHFYLEC